MSDSTPLPKQFRTPKLRQKWWQNLSKQWQMAFQEGFFNKSKNQIRLSDPELQSLLSSPVLRLVGPRGHYPNLTFELQDLQGVSQLTSLKNLFINYHSISPLLEIRTLTQIESLFIHDNVLTSLTGIEKMHSLTNLYCQGNQIASLNPIRQLASLQTIYCSNNKFTSFEGICDAHQHLSRFYCLPNEGILNREIARIQNTYGISCLRG